MHGDHPALPLPLLRIFERLTNGPLCAEALQRVLEGEVTAVDLLPWTRFSAESRCRTRVIRTTRFEMLVLGWLPGQESSIHDHGDSSCAFRVVSGEGWERVGETVVLGAAAPLACGTVTARRPGEFHQFGAADSGAMVSLHVYAPPLSFEAQPKKAG